MCTWRQVFVLARWLTNVDQLVETNSAFFGMVVRPFPAAIAFRGRAMYSNSQSGDRPVSLFGIRKLGLLFGTFSRLAGPSRLF